MARDPNKYGWAPLHILANGKCADGIRAGMISLLVKHDADVEAVRGKADMTPLMMACASGHLAAAHALMSCGADPRKANREGTTCWDLARKNSRAMVEVLEDVGSVKGKGATGNARLIEETHTHTHTLLRRNARQCNEHIGR